MMTEQTKGSALNLLFWQWRNVLLFTIGGLLAYILHHEFGLAWKLPTTPVTGSRAKAATASKRDTEETRTPPRG